MIYIFTALYCEAHILIRHFDLVKNTENIWFQEFCNETAGIRLTITGVGEIAAATAVGSVCSVYRPERGDMLLNVGTCAYTADSDGIFLCNKITEQATGRTFFPDMLYRHNFREKAVVTGMLPWNGEGNDTGLSAAVSIGRSCIEESAAASPAYPDGVREEGASPAFSDGVREEEASPVYPDGVKEEEALPAVSAGKLYDMEAAAIYQAGSSFFGPHQMLFLKVVSDRGAGKEVSREQIESQMEKYQDQISDFMEQIFAITHMARKDWCGEKPLRQEDEALFQSFCTDLHCSKAMKDSVRQYIRYLSLAGTDPFLMIRDMYEKGLLPCKDKREGKLRFEEFKRRVF